jgi:hypothetical protein
VITTILYFVTDDSASPELNIHDASRDDVVAELHKLAGNHPVTPERAAVALIRATTWDIEPSSNPVTELSGLLDFIDLPDKPAWTRKVMAWNPVDWAEYDLPRLLAETS